jgi:serine protease Do
MMSADHASLVRKLESARRRAVLLAVAACALALGVVLGVVLSRRPRANVVFADDARVSREMASAFVEIARQVEPAVVNISTVARGERVARGLSDLPEQFLDRLPFSRERGARRGTGSGIVVDAAGLILTNHHVIEGAERIRVRFYDGAELTARVVGGDGETDLAVLKVEPKTALTVARFGESDKVRVGDWVLAIGSPFGLEQTVTAGIVSAKDRQSSEVSGSSPYQQFLQTDAAINRGNSGGPLVNLAGEVIGINAAIATTNGDYNGISFAIPSSDAVAIYRQLAKEGGVTRGFLGVVLERVTPQIARVYGLPPSASSAAASRGAIVSNISETVEVDCRKEATPAVKAGLRRGDVITEFRGEAVRDDNDLIRRIAATPVGTDVALRLYRDGKEVTVNAVVSRRGGPCKAANAAPDGAAKGLTPAAPAAPAAKPPFDRPSLGIRVANPLWSQIRDYQLGEGRGVIVTEVEPGSVAEDAGLGKDEVIEAVNREAVANLEQFERALSRIRAGEPVVLQVVVRSRQLGLSRRYVSFSKP